MMPETRPSGRHTWFSTAAWRAGTIVLAALCGVTSATPMSGDLRSDDIAAPVAVAPATVEQADAHPARLTAQAREWAERERTEALAVAREAIRAADRATAAVTAATVEHASAARPAEPQHGSLPDLGAWSDSALLTRPATQPAPAEPVDDGGTISTGSPSGATLEAILVDAQALTVTRSHLHGLVGQATAGRGQPTGWIDVARPDETPRSVLAERRLSREIVDAAADLSALALRVEQTLMSEPEPQLPADATATAPALQRSTADADSWPNGAIPLSELCSPDAAPGIFLRCDAAEALDRLAEAYRAANGRELRVFSGYRTYERQAEIKHQHGALAAAPGRSNHGRGIAVDLSDMGGLGEFGAPGYLWMKAHAAAFGWHHPPTMEPGGSGPQEPWHWEFGTWSGYDDRGTGGEPPDSARGPGAGVHRDVSDVPVAHPPITQLPQPATSGAPGSVVPSPESVVPPIAGNAEPPTPPVASAPLEPSTLPGEVPPPTEQDPSQGTSPDGDSPSSEEVLLTEEATSTEESPPAGESLLAEAGAPAEEAAPTEESPPTEESTPTEEGPPSEGTPTGDSPPSEEGTPIEGCSPADESVLTEDSPAAEAPPVEAAPVEILRPDEDGPVGSTPADERPSVEMPPARGALSGSRGSPSGAQTPSTDVTGPPPAGTGQCEVEPEVETAADGG